MFLKEYSILLLPLVHPSPDLFQKAKNRPMFYAYIELHWKIRRKKYQATTTKPDTSNIISEETSPLSKSETLAVCIFLKVARWRVNIFSREIVIFLYPSPLRHQKKEKRRKSLNIRTLFFLNGLPWKTFRKKLKIKNLGWGRRKL